MRDLLRQTGREQPSPSAVLGTEIEQATKWLEAAIEQGLDGVGSSAEAAALFASVERLRRLATVLCVDAVDRVERSGAHIDHGHIDASVMFKHINLTSGIDAAVLKKIRRMLIECELIKSAWRTGDLNVDQAALLARAWSNPRTRNKFCKAKSQYWMLDAATFKFKRFEAKVARWLELNDQDGREPDADPSHERRDVGLVQDHFSKAWALRGSLGSADGAVFDEALSAYIAAEFHADWTAAEAEHGEGNVSKDLLARSDAQRRADALMAIVADAVNNDKPSAPVKTMHNVVWSADTFEEMIRRYTGLAAQAFDPDTYRCETLDGLPLDPYLAFADALTSQWRRVVIDSTNTTIALSTAQRLYKGLARLGIQLTADECYWPGCDMPVSKCQIDHLKPAARGGLTNQWNGKPGCPRHNRHKERGYTVTRNPTTGKIIITTPLGDILHPDAI